MPTDREEYTGGALAAWRYLLGAERRHEIVPGGARAAMGMILNDPRARGDMLGFAHSSIFGKTNPLTGQHEPGTHSRFLNPEYKGEPEMPVRSVVNRLVAGGHLRKDSSEKLVAALAAKTAGLDGSLLIGRVESHWEDRQNWGVLVDEPEIPYHEKKIIRAIEHHRGLLALGVDVGAIARESAFAGLANLSGGALNLAVAQRLADPHRSEFWRGSEFKYDGSSEIYSSRYIEPDQRKAHEAERNAQLATGRYGV